MKNKKRYLSELTEDEFHQICFELLGVLDGVKTSDALLALMLVTNLMTDKCKIMVKGGICEDDKNG